MNTEEFWPQHATDLTQITWSHATNSISALETALADGTMMIEADVSIGDNGTPIMAHPPANTSDLSLEHFLNMVMKATSEGGKKKGIKLDFKYIDIVEPALQLAKSVCADNQLTLPVWLNADIVQLESGSAQPVEPRQFLATCTRLMPRATLSLGFTTNCENKFMSTDFNNLLSLITEFNISQPVTVPLRACLMARSGPEIRDFMKKADTEMVAVPPITFTIWSSQGDSVDVPALVEVVKAIGLNRIYLDVPESLETEIRSKLDEVSRSNFLTATNSLLFTLSLLL